MALQTILIVGREPAASTDLEERLARLGYHVSALAPSADAAIAVSVEHAPDFVMMNGIRPGDAPSIVIEELLRRWRCPIVFLIPERDDARLRSAAVHPPYDCIVEPFTARELRTSLELAMLRHDQRRTVREMEDRYFANSIDMLCFLDFNGYFKRLNPAWERTLGFTRDELMSRPFIEFVHPDDRARTLSQNAAVQSGGQALAFENRYLCKDGSYRWLLWNATPDSAERVIYSMARDVTARKRAQEERELLVRELQAALAEVRTLRDILPICSYCKKIRDDENYWHTVESYISMHTSSLFSHGICPSCMTTEVETQFERIERR